MIFANVATVVVLLTSAGWTQKAGKIRILGPSEAVLEAWNDVGRKLIAVAEDFPEDKYDFKPVSAQRSFVERLLHVAGSNDLFTAVASGKKPIDDESRANYKTKTTVVAYLKKSFADGATVIKSKGDAGMAGAVVAPRVAGLGPPESRSKQ